MKTEIINLVVQIVLVVLSSLVTVYLIPWIKASIDNKKQSVETDKWNQFMEFVNKCVEGVEKIYTPEEWQKKKVEVFNMACSWAFEKGIELTTEQINLIVEGFVQELKPNKKEGEQHESISK